MRDHSSMPVSWINDRDYSSDDATEVYEEGEDAPVTSAQSLRAHRSQTHRSQQQATQKTHQASQSIGQMQLQLQGVNMYVLTVMHLKASATE